jgi:hypothetical protein
MAQIGFDCNAASMVYFEGMLHEQVFRFRVSTSSPFGGSKPGPSDFEGAIVWSNVYVADASYGLGIIDAYDSERYSFANSLIFEGIVD